MDVRVKASQQNCRKRVTVPEIYRKAARILKSAEERKGSLKNLIYSSGFRVSDPSSCGSIVLFNSEIALGC